MPEPLIESELSFNLSPSAETDPEFGYGRDSDYDV
jgi:hypothetical protein